MSITSIKSRKNVSDIWNIDLDIQMTLSIQLSF